MIEAHIILSIPLSVLQRTEYVPQPVILRYTHTHVQLFRLKLTQFRFKWRHPFELNHWTSIRWMRLIQSRLEIDRCTPKSDWCILYAFWMQNEFILAFTVYLFCVASGFFRENFSRIIEWKQNSKLRKLNRHTNFKCIIIFNYHHQCAAASDFRIYFRNNFHVFLQFFFRMFFLPMNTKSRIEKTKDINQHPTLALAATATSTAAEDNNENRFDSIVFACITRGCWLGVCLKDAYFIARR